MMNLVSFETPPLGRKELVHTTGAAATGAKETSSSNTCSHGHLDLSLGISLSRGSGGCDTACCGGREASNHGGRQGRRGGDVDTGRCISSGGGRSTITTTTATASVLSAGHGHVGVPIAEVGWTAAAAFMPSPTGFMHPWSLAARQQKAAAEQDRTQPATYVTSHTRVVPSPSAVGWPPVHTSRRNLVTSMNVSKPDAVAAVGIPKGDDTDVEKNMVTPEHSTVVQTRPPANMFAKVHMEGYGITRKINLRAHGSYDSLSRVLTKMTRNFFCPADCSDVNVGEEEFSNCENFIFLYEDFEGDRMLVGDVPWDLFLSTVKRLYIVENPASGDKGHVDDDKERAVEEAKDN